MLNFLKSLTYIYMLVLLLFYFYFIYVTLLLSFFFYKLVLVIGFFFFKVSGLKSLLIVLKSFIIFILVIVIRIVIPRYKIESLTKLGWAYSLVFILENFFFL